MLEVDGTKLTGYELQYGKVSAYGMAHLLSKKVLLNREAV